MSALSPVVLDNGTLTIKAGLAGDDSPKVVFRNIVGRTPQTETSQGGDYYIGEEAQKRRDVLSLSNPIERGVVTNWENMEKIWDNVFSSDLQIDPEEHPVLLTDAPLNPKANREKTIQIMFETFNVPKLYVIKHGPLSLYASGRSTGTVVISGEGVSSVIPIYEGYALPHAVQHFKLAGNDITLYLAEMLNRNGYSFTSSAELEVVREIKEKLCRVVLDSTESSNQEESASKGADSTYNLPDGQVIDIGNDSFLCPEALFQPSLRCLESTGIHKAVFESINKCDISVRKDLYPNVVLSGGNTLFPGFVERMLKGLQSLVPGSMSVKIVTPIDRINSEWTGGSVLASLDSFQKMWILKQDYDEAGPGIVHQKCV